MAATNTEATHAKPPPTPYTTIEAAASAEAVDTTGSAAMPDTAEGATADQEEEGGTRTISWAAEAAGGECWISVRSCVILTNSIAFYGRSYCL